MSIFSEDLIQNEEDLIRHQMNEVYKKMMKEMVKSSNIILEKSRRGSANYIVTGVPVIEKPEKMFTLSYMISD